MEQLKRRIGLPLLTAYGVGVMVGAGIYVLIGAVAGAAGVWAPVSFLVAGLIAAPSALSYAELSTRHPEAAGEAAYIEKGLNSRILAILIGLAIVAVGTISAAAVLRGGTGYLIAIVQVDQNTAIIAIGITLTLIALIGALESLAFAALLTLVEVIGLALVIYAGFTGPSSADFTMPPAPEWGGIWIAATLAFFAFIGFEDIVNMAEEVHKPERTLPRAILWSLAITTGLYILVSLAAIRIVPIAELAETNSPLALVWERATGQSAAFLAMIAVLAALNGVLAQIVMASRVLFGLGKRTPVLAIFRKTHHRFATPILATVLLGTGTILAALALPVAELAEVTTLLLLIIFAVVNVALIASKRADPTAPFCVHILVPWLGLVTALGALGFALFGASVSH